MSPDIAFRHLDTPAELSKAFTLMRVLRPHLADADAFVAQLERQRGETYRLLAAFDGERLLGLAGYRHQTNLLYGRFVYVDDLVVDPERQGHRVGARLLDAVRGIARDSGYARLVLDTGLHMALAQRFYFRNGLLARGLHFVEPLSLAGEAA
ncbi:GCN5 family acetyltransferase [Burkholderia gladioli]|uniref:GNAT family N-acetyltransferase n=1 Tax=Burkholderia gladioli TaxID=28095 RepID=UPI000757E255|nr:GNAT family N-acetyltransferase [Burkholderia gladioli]KVM62938.1 GCN5 family acetyltransferase [Burkholderia gladioli]